MQVQPESDKCRGEALSSSSAAATIEPPTGHPNCLHPDWLRLPTACLKQEGPHGATLLAPEQPIQPQGTQSLYLHSVYLFLCVRVLSHALGWHDQRRGTLTVVEGGT